MGRTKSHWDFGYSVVREKTQSEGVIPVAKTPVNFDSEIVQSLLQGYLTCLQSVAKDLIEHALESKAKQEQKKKASAKQPINMAKPEAVVVNM